MTSFESIAPDTVLAGTTDWITPERLRLLAAHPLDCVSQEFPHAVRSVESATERIQPAADHPVFYGCYDWHSAVHTHWTLVRQLRLAERHPSANRIVESIDRRFHPATFEREAAYLDEHPSFEKPYGWGWLLRLAAELHRWQDDRAERWRAALRPLEEQVVALVTDEFLEQDRAFRVGTHLNTAFALGCVLDYARVTSAAELETAATEAANRFFGTDRNAPVAYEPFGWDFLSPTLVEADLMRRVLDDGFASWLDGFLPDLTAAPAEPIRSPLAVEAHPDEGIALHFVGLNLSRAWCLAGIADAIDGGRDTTPFEEAARRHAEAGLTQAFTADYAGAHWLSSFVLYLLTRNAGGIAPS